MDKIITAIWNDPWYKNKLKKMLGWNGRNSLYDNSQYFDDVFQDIIVILYNQEESVIDSWNGGKMKQYYNKILYNQILSKTSPFYVKYRKKAILNSDIDVNSGEKGFIEFDDVIYQNDFDIKDYFVRNKTFDWYENEIFTMYYKIGSNILFQDRDEKVSYLKIANKLGLTYDKISRRMDIIRYKMFMTIINDVNLVNDIKFGDEEGGLIYMNNFIEKFKKRNKNYDKYYKL